MIQNTLSLSLKVPLKDPLYSSGNMQKEANEMIETSGLDMLPVPDFDTAAKIVSSSPPQTP